MKTIYVVAGISGSGKSTVVEPLANLLGVGWKVWDIDPMVENMPDHGHPELPRLASWNPGDGEGLFDVCKNAVVDDAIRSEAKVVLCGTLLPSEIYEETTEGCHLRWFGLYASKDVIASRLSDRGWPDEKVEFFKNSFDWFKDIPDQVVDGMPLIDTTHLSPQESARILKEKISKIDLYARE